jgi:hypothetical protein
MTGIAARVHRFVNFCNAVGIMLPLLGERAGVRGDRDVRMPKNYVAEAANCSETEMLPRRTKAKEFSGIGRWVE